MKLANLTIGRRLGVGFLVVVLCMVGLVAVGGVQVNRISDRLTVINDVNAVKQSYAVDFRGSVHDRAIAVRDLVLATTSAEVQTEVDTIAGLTDDYDEAASKMADIFADESKVNSDEKSALADIETVQAATLPMIEQMISLRQAGNVAGALKVLTDQAKASFVEWLRVINVFIDLEASMNQDVTSETRDIADGFFTVMLALCVVAVLLAIAVAWWVTRSITRPLDEAGTVLRAVAQGDLTRRLDVASNDEVGQMGRSMNTALAAIGGVMAEFDRSAGRLAGASARIGELSATIATDAVESSSQADVVSAAADEVSRNVQVVATGAGEMGTSIREISHNANEAATVGAQAVTAVETTTATISRLGESSREIGDVVKTITSIAEQTNLLALNATIEAARAGESGKGFAVVANEVKELAQETARATEDISRRVEAIQNDTGSAVAAIGDVTRVITQINDYQTTIASAVEEQTATTTEMNRSVAEAASGSTRIAASIGGVAEASRATTASVAQSQDAARELADVSSQLQGLIAGFRF
ncbi:methyl-accepting chemotaxis protein [Cryptosporangium aurantiacum]|uniref:Methyl-accepting chemotaxis protein n=1 Tax=Cryptosporangium aurantiacum TaxID=134849 RepID=A0A1M7RM14_9ACTN|nr:methyl-accepting chemotaxis protein [Cryptosporangium aurantiacum]SHN47357.1 methyl-accepting chemotaxis protein [Cryptosporangium aurantiacum]